jgi:hypothetical protein
MSATVKLGSALPADFEMNGLDAQAESLVEEPLTLRCAVIWYDAPTAAIDNEKSTTVPKVQIRRFEPLGDADEVTKAIKVEVEKAIEKRTGRRPIPWDITEITDEHKLGDTLPEDDE